jgi:hypothetical protein
MCATSRLFPFPLRIVADVAPLTSWTQLVVGGGSKLWPSGLGWDSSLAIKVRTLPLRSPPFHQSPIVARHSHEDIPSSDSDHNLPLQLSTLIFITTPSPSRPNGFAISNAQHLHPKGRRDEELFLNQNRVLLFVLPVGVPYRLDVVAIRHANCLFAEATGACPNRRYKQTTYWPG